MSPIGNDIADVVKLFALGDNNLQEYQVRSKDSRYQDLAWHEDTHQHVHAELDAKEASEWLNIL